MSLMDDDVLTSYYLGTLNIFTFKYSYLVDEHSTCNLCFGLGKILQNPDQNELTRLMVPYCLDCLVLSIPARLADFQSPQDIFFYTPSF